MDQYVGLDVSMEETSVCVLDQDGTVLFEGTVPSKPQAIAKILDSRAAGAVRIGLEAGALSSWLWQELKARGLPVICLDARHAHRALSMRINKSDRNDARGLAELVRMGWYREARVKDPESRRVRAILTARAQLVDLRRDIENQVRGLFKSIGVVIGKAGTRTIAGKISTGLRQAPHFRLVIEPLMRVHSALAEQILTYDEQIRDLSQANATVQRLMTVPGVGALTALAYVSTINDPKRFKSASDVGAYLGLTPRRYQSGELDRTGRISKRGDSMLRKYLFEAANVLLTVVRRNSTLKAWGIKLSKRIGFKKAKTAVARKLAVILHCIWTDGTEFQWARASA